MKEVSLKIKKRKVRNPSVLKQSHVKFLQMIYPEPTGNQVLSMKHSYGITFTIIWTGNERNPRII